MFHLYVCMGLMLREAPDHDLHTHASAACAWAPLDDDGMRAFVVNAQLSLSDHPHAVSCCKGWR